MENDQYSKGYADALKDVIEQFNYEFNYEFDDVLASEPSDYFYASERFEKWLDRQLKEMSVYGRRGIH